MRIVIDDNVEKNRVSVRISGQCSDLNFMDALIGSLTKIRKNGNGKENPNQMLIEPEPVPKNKGRKKK
jgi:hypothetical protein